MQHSAWVGPLVRNRVSWLVRASGMATWLPALGVAGGVFALLSATGASAPRVRAVHPTPAEATWIGAGTQDPGAGDGSTCALTVRVASAARSPADVALRLGRLTPRGSAELWDARTDAAGTHRFTGLVPGEYALTVLPDGAAPQAAQAFVCSGRNARGFAEVTLGDAQTVAVQGALRSKSRGPAPLAELSVAQDNNARGALAGTVQIPVDDAGHFTTQLPPGDYVFLAQAPGHAAEVWRQRITPSQTPLVIKRSLRATPEIRGVVVDEAGAPVPQALVAVGGLYDPNARPLRTTTDATGAFVLPVPDGVAVTVTVQGARADGSGVFAVQTFPAEHPLGGFTGVGLVAHAGRTVTGAVLVADGSPRPFAPVHFRVRARGLEGLTQADASGQFALAGMPLTDDVEVWAEGNASGAWGARVASPGDGPIAVTYIEPAFAVAQR